MKRLLGIGLAASIMACGGGTTKGAKIKIGLNDDLSGPAASYGTEDTEVATMVVETINKAGGIAGRDLELVVADNGFQADKAVSIYRDFASQGVVGIVGPLASSQVTAMLPSIKELKVVNISHASTAPGLADADDGGFLFRSIGPDSIQGIAMAVALRGQTPPVDKIAILHVDDPYGNGLKDALVAEFTKRGGSVLGAVKYVEPLDTAKTTAAWDAVVALNPPTVVTIAQGGDAVRIVQHWDDSATLPAVKWFFAEAARGADLANARPAKLAGALGTAPAAPSGDAPVEFEAAFNAKYGRNSSMTFSPFAYDSIYLLALALAKQAKDHPGEALGGDNLRTALVAVSGPPGTAYRASEFAAAVKAIERGEDIDYDGATGPVDFDAKGEVLSLYEVWKVVNNAGVGSIAREDFLDAADLK